MKALFCLKIVISIVKNEKISPLTGQLHNYHSKPRVFWRTCPSVKHTVACLTVRVSPNYRYTNKYSTGDSMSWQSTNSGLVYYKYIRLIVVHDLYRYRYSSMVLSQYMYTGSYTVITCIRLTLRLWTGISQYSKPTQGHANLTAHGLHGPEGIGSRSIRCGYTERVYGKPMVTLWIGSPRTTYMYSAPLRVCGTAVYSLTCRLVQ